MTRSFPHERDPRVWGIEASLFLAAASIWRLGLLRRRDAADEKGATAHLKQGLQKAWWRATVQVWRAAVYSYIGSRLAGSLQRLFGTL
ncbi:hypothetical protein TIFTF001_016994 [Ficus carica]|uniref:Uncharacterized protein n=1 Tax=Ficus carica TaxID=3494 RepID=A0AA88ABC9_FICCA|nr:hypothetical protein TIFTF001_016994 [Ficus carica]